MSTNSPEVLSPWQGSNLITVGDTAVTLSSLVKAHNLTTKPTHHLWISLFGASTRKETVEPGRCMLLVEYKDKGGAAGGRLSTASGTGGGNGGGGGNPRADMDPSYLYYTRGAQLDTLGSMQTEDLSRPIGFSPKDIDLGRYEIFVQVQPGTRKIAAKSIIAICDPAILPKETTPAPILEARSGNTPTPSTAGAKRGPKKKDQGGVASLSVGGGGILSIDKQFSDLASMGAASIGSKKSRQPATGARSGDLALLAEELGVGQKRDRLGGSLADQSNSGTGGNSPTPSDMLFNRGESSLDGLAPTSSSGGLGAEKTEQTGEEEEEADPRKTGSLGTRQLIAVADSLAGRKNEQPLHTCITGLMAGGGTKKQALNSSLAGKGMTIGDTTWYRYHPHALSAVIFPGRSSRGGDDEGSAADSTSFTANLRNASIMSSQRIAAFAIDGTLFNSKLFDSKNRGSNAFELSHPAIPELLSNLHTSGYRIVLFASYPSLHHATSFALQEKTERIVKFYRKHLAPSESSEGGGVPSVTAILSTVSSFLSDSPFHMPRSGLWKYFIENHNRGVEANPETSFFCGNFYDRERWAVKSGDKKMMATTSSRSENNNDVEVEKNEGESEEASRWTYQSVEEEKKGNEEATADDKTTTGATDVAQNSSSESALVQWDVDWGFAEACGLRFIPAGDFYQGKGVISSNR